VAKRALSEVNIFTHELESILQIVIRINSLNKLSQEKQGAVLANLINFGDERHINVFEELFLIDSKGLERVRVDRLKIYIQEDMRELSTADIFLNPLINGEKFYGPVLINRETGEPFIRISTPTIDLRSGKIDGVLVAKIRLQAAWDTLTNIQVGERGQAYIADKMGRIVAHRNRSLVFKGASITPVTDDYSVEKDFDDNYVLRANKHFYLGDQELWLITDTPLSEALSQTINLIQTIAALLFLSITGAIVLGILVQKNFIRPIEMLSETAEAITEGDLEKRAAVKYDDEIGSLANNFNTMAARLVETIDSLKKEVGERKKAEKELKKHRNTLAIKVEEATADLIRTNEKLLGEIQERLRIEKELNNYRTHLEDLVEERTSKLLNANQQLKEEMIERKRASEKAAVMEERSRLARELHDSVTQSLYSLTLFAETGKKLAANRDFDRLENCLADVADTSQVILKEMRLLVYDLRPSALEDEGLIGALQKRLDFVEQRSGVRATLEMQGDDKLSIAMEEGLYRIAQEALNNALKHASAKNVTVRIINQKEKIEMIVEDDGIGFDSAAEEDGKGGMGMDNIKERTEKLGGTIEIVASPQKGTKIKCSIPKNSD
jgi:signal transduction histidine kinase